MKVRELQEHLSKLDPELNILCCSEDEKLLSENEGFILFDISAVNVSEAEWLRLEDNTLNFKFGRGPNSVKMAILDVSTSF